MWEIGLTSIGCAARGARTAAATRVGVRAVRDGVPA